MSFKKIDCNLTQKFSEYPDFGVLNGVKVFVSGTAIAGPFAGCLMAEMGAKVLQSEAPKISCGTRGTTSWSQNHRNEYSITCNPRTPAGKKIFKKCLEWADIWIESSKAGTYAKMGLTDEVCWGVNSKLCIVHVSGYGQTGPYKSKASYDVSGQAMGGYMYMNGVSPTDVPLKVNPYLSDYVTAYNACMTALSAYIHALKTGKGESCDVAQYDTMFRLLDNYPVLWYNKGYPKDGEPVPYRTGNHSDLAACFSFYTTKDNKQLFVAINGPGPVEKGYPIIGVGTPGVTPGLPKGIPGFPLNTPMGQKADQALTDFCAKHTCAELEEIFNKVGIPNQRAYEPGDIENDPQYALSRASLDALEAATDAKGRHFTVHKLPIPAKPICVTEEELQGYAFEEGEDTREAGERLAASYVNFYISNGGIILPQFGDENDAEAVRILGGLFPGRRVYPIPARSILVGGGNIHCVTQQIPRG